MSDEGQPQPLDDTRLAEIRSLLRYETSISFHSARAKESMLLLLAEAEEAARLRARVAELEKAAEEIRFLHKDSPMGPCPVCVDGDAMARGDDPTVPYPCPTARLAGAKDFDPPSFRTNPAQEAS